jgi:hypothetical protein
VLDLTGDFINIAKPEMVWADIYPYYGGQACMDTCQHTGGRSRTTDYTGYYNISDHWGQQYALNYAFLTEADRVNQACRARSRDWWLFPQAFGHIFYSDSCIECDNNWYFRLPTKSELTCNVFMGICSGARGIIFWKYHGRDTEEVYSPGLLYPDGDSVTPGWYAVKDLAPYVHAIGNTLRDIEWEAAYPVHHGTPSFDPPSGAWIYSITAVSDTPNPDLGWFHVGQFTEGSDKYVMLVNRACSQGEDDPTPAPSVTATVRFDPGDLGLGNYVYVIDLADSLYRDTTTGEWVGVPETTYTAKMPDGAIPFTTVLGPGEGRLFKIVETVKKT